MDCMYGCEDKVTHMVENVGGVHGLCAYDAAQYGYPQYLIPVTDTAAVLALADKVVAKVDATLAEWSGEIAPTTTTTEGDELRAKAAASDREAYDSFERCDTDGALSQWSHGVNAQLYRLQADIADNGGMWTFPALFDTEGNLVAAKEIETRYGWSWALLDPSNPDGRFLGWFNESKAQNDARKIAADARKGYYVGTVRVPAYAKLAGGNICTVTACVFRSDGGWSADAEIVDNGQNN